MSASYPGWTLAFQAIEAIATVGAIGVGAWAIKANRDLQRTQNEMIAGNSTHERRPLRLLD